MHTGMSQIKMLLQNFSFIFIFSPCSYRFNDQDLSALTSSKTEQLHYITTVSVYFIIKYVIIKFFVLSKNV